MRIICKTGSVECNSLQMNTLHICTDLKSTLDYRLGSLCCRITVNGYRTSKDYATQDIWSLGISHLDHGCLVCNRLNEGL